MKAGSGVRSKNKSCLVFLGSRVASWERSSSTWTDRSSFLWEDQQHSRASSPSSETPTHTHAHTQPNTHSHPLVIAVVYRRTRLINYDDSADRHCEEEFFVHSNPIPFFLKMFLSFTLRTHQSHNVGQNGGSKACATFRGLLLFFFLCSAEIHLSSEAQQSGNISFHH